MQLLWLPRVPTDRSAYRGALAIEETAGELRRAVLAGRTDEATSLLDTLVGLLTPHVAAEENGLFAELRAEGSLADGVDRLRAEHEDLHHAFGGVNRADPDWPAVLAGLDRLHRHIDNEEHGLFPAAVVALPIATWDRITPVTSA
jgi:hemerythrin-like domain-containing protein